MGVRVQTLEGKIVEEFSEDIHHRGRLDAPDLDRQGAVVFHRHAALPAGDYKLVTALVDVNSQAFGSKVQSFRVPTPASAPLLSDLVLVGRIEHVSAPDEPQSNPLRFGANEIVPDLSGVVGRGASEARVVFSVRTVDGAAPSVTLSLTRDGKEIGRPVPRALPAATAGAPGATYISTLHLSGLAPGRYDVTVTVTQAKVTEQRHLVLERTGEPASSQAAAELEAEPDAETTLLSTRRAPSAQLASQWIETARERALGYQGKLPNFICFEIIDRSTDRSGKGRWAHRDTISELLTYRDQKESRMVLRANGSRADAEHSDLRGPRSNGEYGGLLQAVFDPAAEARFEWQGEASISGTTLQLFRYHVVQSKSDLSLTDAKLSTINAAIHGWCRSSRQQARCAASASKLTIFLRTSRSAPAPSRSTTTMSRSTTTTTWCRCAARSF